MATARRKPPSIDDPATAAKRERLRVAILNARARDAGLEPVDRGLKAPLEELDPYLKAQLQLLEKLIDASRDEQTGVPTKHGPLEYLFTVWNDTNIDVDKRVRAATSALTYFHKRVPAELTLADDDAGDDGATRGVVDSVSKLLSRIVGGKHAPHSPAVAEAIAKEKK